MVVAVGVMLVEPLDDVEVNVPGVMAMVVAPAAAQLSVLLVPEFMLVGAAVKEVIVGADSFPGDELGVPQPASPKQANITRASAQRVSRRLESHGYTFALAPGSALPFTQCVWCLFGAEVSPLDWLWLYRLIPSKLYCRRRHS